MSAIEWTDETWNPVTGCQKVSQGCRFCYAEVIADRFWATQYPPNADGSPRRFTDVRTHPDRLDQPLRWRAPRMVFVNSMSDLFHEDVPNIFIAEVWAAMEDSPRHTFQVLTKRPGRARDVLGSMPHFPVLPNVWLGVSVEDQATADERIPLLLDTPAAVRFVSYEPALAAVDFRAWLGWRAVAAAALGTSTISMGPDGISPSSGIDWLICGGESGPGARPFDLAWARSVIAQCREAAVPVFCKQIGARPIGRWNAEYDLDGHQSMPWVKDRKGGDISEWPEDLRVREFPRGQNGEKPGEKPPPALHDLASPLRSDAALPEERLERSDPDFSASQSQKVGGLASPHEGGVCRDFSDPHGPDGETAA